MKTKQLVPTVAKEAAKAISGAAQKLRGLRLDDWRNFVTGLGTAASKLSHAHIIYRRFSELEAEELYAASDAARKIVDELPREAFRAGYELVFPKAPELVKTVEDYLKEMHFDTRNIEAWINGRMYGGGAIVPITDDVANFDKPLNENTIREITNLLVVSRWELAYTRPGFDIRSEHYGHPESYILVPRGGMTEGITGQEIHASRVIRFDGAYLTRRMFIQNAYWGDSYLHPAHNHIRNYDTALDAIATAIQDFSVAMYKIKGLADMVADDQAGDMIKVRMHMIDIARSIARCVVVDADGEDFQYQQRSFAAIPDLLEKLAARLVASADMPHTKVLGEGPQGFGKNGDSEQGDWYDKVKAAQETYLRPKLTRQLNLIFQTKKGPTGGRVPDGWQLNFHPLWQQSEKEKADTRFTTAQADQIYITEGVLDPTEVRDSRFGSGKFSSETQIQPGLTPTPPDPEEDLQPDPAAPGSLPPNPEKPALKAKKTPAEADA